MDTKRKSLVKTISWRIIATGITIGTIYAFTGNIAFSGEVGIIINVVKAFAYYLHERLYAKMT
ncbi:MAG: DUF2061 domain-containing protein [Candidatus Hecatellales archaeon]|nr:MAG: DUF2061 domain-containing protein [Candidatus Hecatellales archaeon]